MSRVEKERAWGTLFGILVLFVIDKETPQLACVASQGFAVLEGNSTLTYISQPLPKAHLPYIRFNDGACDSKGRFFAGTIHSKDQGIPGQLWRYDPADGSCVVVDEGPFTVRYSLPYTLLVHCMRVGFQWPGLECGREDAVNYIICTVSAGF